MNIQGYPTATLYEKNIIAAFPMKITLTGALRTPLVLFETSGNIIWPEGPTIGQVTYPVIPGLSLGAFSIGEGNAATGLRLQTISFDDLVGMSGDLTFTQCAALTALGFPALKSATGLISVNNCALLSTIDFSQLRAVGGQLTLQNLAALIVASFPNLESITTGLTVSGSALLSTLSLASLRFAGSLSISTSGALNSISFPALIRGGNVSIGAAILPLVSFPTLAYVNGLTINNSPMLATVNFPAVIEYAAAITMNSGNGAIANLTLGTPGTLKLIGGANTNLVNQSLTAASVNNLLALLVSLDGTNGTTLWGAGKTLNISGGISAAPSGQGIIDKATLIGRGAVVTTN